jgi:hypothetical protein
MSAPFAGGSPAPGQGNWGPAQQPPVLNQMESGYNIPANLRPAVAPPGMAMGGQSLDAGQNGQQLALNAPARDRQMNISPGLDRQNSDNSLLSAPDKKASGSSRRPSGSRVCGKCGKSLSGQFVRALDATYHLECFTCHVNCSESMFNAGQLLTRLLCRNATRLLRPSSSLYQTTVRTNIPSARRITSNDSI